MDCFGLFLALFAAVVSVTANHETLLCSGTRHIHSSPSTHTGYITSPNHPKAYPAENMQCTFKFHPKADEQVQLTFSYFNLRESKNIPASQNCDLSDSVKIFVGSSRTNADPGNQIGEYCGKKSPENVMAVGHPLTVTFTVRAKEDPSVSAVYMFKAKFTFMKNYGLNTHAQQNHSAGCHFIFDGRRVSAKGSFTSPNFGGLYPFGVNCLYTFRSFGNQSIQLNFDTFEIDGQYNCRRSDDDVVYIKEKEISWNNFLISAEEDNMKRDTNTTMHCGMSKPTELISNKPVVNVVFKSGQMRSKNGFRGTYAFIGHPGEYLPGTGNSLRSSGIILILISAMIAKRTAV